MMYENLSSTRSINAGIPQGSVLGPLLFYVNDVSDSNLSMSILYADENSIQCSSYNVAVIEQQVNHDLNNGIFNKLLIKQKQ